VSGWGSFFANCPPHKTARTANRHPCRVSAQKNRTDCEPASVQSVHPKKPHGPRTGIRAEPHNHTPHQTPTRSILATFMVRPICHTPQPENPSDRSPEPHNRTPYQSPTRSILATFAVYPTHHTTKPENPSERSPEPHNHTPHQSPTRSILATFMVYPTHHTPKPENPSDRSSEPQSRIPPRAGGFAPPRRGGMPCFCPLRGDH